MMTDDVVGDTARLGLLRREVVVQEYICRPLVIKGHKVDFRIYVLVTEWEVDRQTAYVHDVGLVRFASAPYSLEGVGRQENVFAHVTNNCANNKNLSGANKRGAATAVG
eukprot:CAMPEP_0182899220 /NCGR_PEP_ID=MMETSP0034_2-20130328/27950_1 /TAXON_ID=156128 /ORGANISM="Nephroselmis pyriformis, Strain CCMP717" /LENGTH=108 /DNA_ID=CAMNT_0025033233 /DNA_START=32 /DNA_END=354 /DNA_ORIENTATION=-